MSDYNFSEFSMRCILSNEERRYERNPRKGALQPTFLLHRFPIKGGLTFSAVLAHNVMKTNSLLRYLVEKDRVFA